MARIEDSPIARFNRWMEQARRMGAAIPEAMALATADRRGRVSVRFVLVKQADERGFVFYTDMRSRKGCELRQNPYASLAFYWDPSGKQVRIDGPVEQVSAEEADAYWATRPRQSRLAASASRQSAVLADRRELLATVERLKRKFKRAAIARPSYWSGFRLRPQAIEFWTRRSHRLHERELYVRTSRGWKRSRLQP